MSGTDVVDIVIVGAGSAGCVLANRLTEDPSTSVALIEAGGPDDKQEIRIPAAFTKLFKSPCDWAFHTAEQVHLDNRRLYWPRGKMIGGCSSMNAMIYTRGHQRDFDEWERLGNQGWGYSDVVPFFEKAEGRSSGNGNGCALEISTLRSTNPLSHAFLEACEAKGIPRVPELRTEAEEGASFFHVTQRAGRRHSCAAAYLKPALGRPNLDVRVNAHTTRVLFEGDRAVGVEYVRNGTGHTVRAERQVILSGGAVSSPQLLMLSGVGPADELRKLRIPVVADVPGVGRNLQDHLITGAAHECTQPITMAAAETLGNLLRFLLLRKGMLTSNVAEAGAFVRTGSEIPVPDLELIFGPVYFMNHGFSNPPGHGFTIGAILLHPRSRGSIRLHSADPLDAPLIQPEYLEEHDDLRLLVEGTKLCLEIARTKPFDRYRGREIWPGPERQDDRALEQFVRGHVETLYHPVGTCRMGSDPSAVVDERLRVHGTDRLRIIDASVMPTIVTGHPNAAVVMIAEKGAEMIRADA